MTPTSSWACMAVLEKRSRARRVRNEVLSIVIQRRTCLTVLFSLALSLPASFVAATTLLGLLGPTEPIPIAKLMSSPESFHLHIIYMRGTVRSVAMLEPHD